MAAMREQRRDNIRSRIDDVRYWAELLGILTISQLKARYRRSFFGFLWSLAVPLFQIVIVGFVIQELLQHNISNFTVKYLCGLLPWLYINDTILGACPTFILYREVVKKIYFPRWILPLATSGSSLVHFFLSLIILIAVFAIIGIAYQPSFLFLPVLIALMVLMASGLALLFSVMHTFYQDTEYALTTLLRVFMFVTPVFYPTAEIPEKYQYWFLFNPLATICEGFRGCLLRNELPRWDHLLACAAFSVLCVLIGVAYYRARGHELPEVL